MKKVSRFGEGWNAATPPDDVGAARKLISHMNRNVKADIITPLQKTLDKHPDLATAFAWLHVYDRREADDNSAMAMLVALLDATMFSPAQRKRSGKAAADELEKALRDKAVPDELKITILPLLEMAGRPVPDKDVGKFFQDYEAAVRRHSEEFAKKFSDSPASLSKFLLANGLISDEENYASGPVSTELASQILTLGHGIALVNPAGATLMTAALIFRVGAPEFSHERSLGQLDGIHALATPRARWCLETLANWPGFSMPFRSKAAKLAAELAGHGIKSQAPLAPGEFSHGIVAMIDGMGSRTATLFHRTQKGELDAFNVMYNDEVGIKDAFAFFGNGDELEGMLRSNFGEMSTANSSLALFRELMADSFALHEELGTAPPGCLFPLLAYLGNQPVTPQKREPNLDAYKLETVCPTPDQLTGGIDLADHTLFGCLFPASDAAYSFCEKHWDKRKKCFREADFLTFLKEVMPLERERLLHRMAINLEVEALAGRAGLKDNKTAARLWLGMKENVLPLEGIPFVQELARTAVEHISRDLRRGYKNQREALLAGEMDPRKQGEASGKIVDLSELDSLSKSERESFLTGLMRQLYGDAESGDLPPPEFFGPAPLHGAKPRAKAKPKKAATKGGWVYVGPPEKKVKPSTTKKIDSAKNTENRIVYRLSVDLRGYPPMLDDFMSRNPEITRKIEIAGDQTLDDLHWVIFKAFNREDAHLYEFQLSAKPHKPGAHRYTHHCAMEDDPTPSLVHNAETTTLDQLGLKTGQTFLYWFDFGDDWWHGITVKEIGPPTPHAKYPRIVSRHGSSPPQYPEEYKGRKMINRRALAIRRRKGLRQCRRWSIGADFLTPRFIGRAGTTPVPCSCFMCGNPRRKAKGKERLTMQERKALIAMHDMVVFA